MPWVSTSALEKALEANLADEIARMVQAKLLEQFPDNIVMLSIEGDISDGAPAPRAEGVSMLIKDGGIVSIDITVSL